MACIGQDAWRDDVSAQGIPRMSVSWRSCKPVRSLAFVSPFHRGSEQTFASPFCCVYEIPIVALRKAPTNFDHPGASNFACMLRKRLRPQLR